MRNAQIAALEQRIDTLEEVLRVQAVIIGQCLSRPAPPSTASSQNWLDWQMELGRNLRCDPVPQMSHAIIEQLQRSLVTNCAPTPESLRA